MSNQAIEHEEVINIRWAHDDPNPVAQQSRKRCEFVIECECECECECEQL